MMILFQLYFEVAPQKRAEFEQAYAQVFEPALRKQIGFQSVTFLRLDGAAESSKIGAAPTEFNYQVNFVFDSEESRQRWSTSRDHDAAWPKFSAIAQKATWRGYELLVA
jgi:heme-degrading monooxygenase HmoA